MEKALVVIPARFASTRFPGKPLVHIGNKTMIERVVNQASACPEVSDVWVATDHEAIMETVLGFGGKAVMTSPDCLSGTDRCAEVVRSRLVEENIIVNVQGDEPFIRPEQISEIITLMQSPSVGIGTLARKITDPSMIFNPNVVKLVRSREGKALYFSRNPIPFIRGEEKENWFTRTDFFHHIGMYAYRKSVLLEISELAQGSLEQAESLEQLRWLEAGYSIYAANTDFESIGIDTPEDLLRVAARLGNE